MAEHVEYLEGEIDGRRWKATWTPPLASIADWTRGAWRIVVDDHIRLPAAGNPNPDAGAEACRAELETMIRGWFAEQL